jgi:two-component system sensor histidine kinase MprB
MLLLAVISAATAVSVGFVSYELMQQRLRTEIDRSLVEATNRFLDGPNGVRRFRIGDRLSIIIPDRPLGIEQYVVQVASGDGDVIATTPGVSLPVVTFGDDVWRRVGDDGTIVRTVTSGEGDRYRVRTVALNLPRSQELVLQIGRDLSETENVLSDLRARIFIIGSIVVIVAALVGGVISTGVTSRLRRLSRSVEHIADTGDLIVDLSIEGSDETSRLAKSFGDMVSALHESRSQQRRLVQDAGHELRTPLTSLRTNLDVLRRHPDLPDSVRAQVLTDLDQDITELRNLVEEIVTLAAEVDPTSIESESIETVELGELVRGVVDRVQRRTNRTIQVDVDGSLVAVRPIVIERAVSNLLDNAVKFDVTAGTIEVEVKSGTVTVRDRGPGIPEADLEAVFARFHRSSEARSMPGSGLGLSIVADAALAHGGGHFARRREGGGAEVGFWLPLAVR